MKHLLYILCLFVLSCDSGGSGVVHGCIDSQACNYNPNATLDNNSCEYDCEDIFCDPVGTITGYGDCDGSDDSDGSNMEKDSKNKGMFSDKKFLEAIEDAKINIKTKFKSEQKNAQYCNEGRIQMVGKLCC